MHRHFLQLHIPIERRRIGITTHHRNGIVVQLLQVLKLDGVVTALDKTHAVEQVFAGELPQVRTRVVVPGVDQHVVAPLAQTEQRPGPGHLLKITGIAGARQCGTDYIGGQPAVHQGGVGERRPGIGDQPQLLRLNVLAYPEQTHQRNDSMQSRHAKKSLGGRQPNTFSAELDDHLPQSGRDLAQCHSRQRQPKQITQR